MLWTRGGDQEKETNRIPSLDTNCHFSGPPEGEGLSVSVLKTGYVSFPSFIIALSLI